MSALPREALRRGWCPSTLRPMETGDGWLVRLHPPGAVLSPEQLIRIAALAREHGNGLIEITARGNMQLRGVTAESHPALVATLLAERLVDEHDGDGPQRLTLTAPLALPPPACGGEGRGGGQSRSAPPSTLARAPLFAPPPQPSPAQAGGGSEVGDLIDAAALAGDIESLGRAIPGLPSKLLIVVDGGGALSLDGFGCDLRLVGVAPDTVALGLPDGSWRGPVTSGQAGEVVAAMLTRFAALRAEAPDAIRRMRHLSSDALAELCALPAPPAPLPRLAPRRVGLFALGSGRFAAIAALPFGRCDAATLEALGRSAEAQGAGQLRLSPWRGLACPDLGGDAARAWLDDAAALGLIVRDDDPRLSVQACSGKPACQRGQTAAMADAALVAQATAPLLARGLRVHVSGCAKSCAHPGASDLTLVGRDGRYDVVLHGTTRDAPVATLDLSEVLRRLQPGQDLFARLTAAGDVSGQPV